MTRPNPPARCSLAVGRRPGRHRPGGHAGTRRACSRAPSGRRGQAAAACRLERRAASSRQGAPGDPALHERRRQPDGHVRLTSPSSTAATARRLTRGATSRRPTSAPGKLMKSPFAFRQHGECGRWVSSVFPEIATCVDDLAFLMALSLKDQRPRAGQLHDEHRLLDARDFRAWGRGFRTVWARSADNLPTFVVLARSQRGCRTTPRETSRRASCRSRTRG